MPEESSNTSGRDEQPALSHFSESEAELSPPELLQRVRIPEREQRFHPSPPNRRGELFAWISAAGMGIVLLLSAYGDGDLRFLPLLLFLVFFTTGVMISFGNWIDSRTWVRTSPIGIHYHSPLRDVRLEWEEVRQLMARRLGRGWRITVGGARGYFRFRTGVTLRRGSDRQFVFGFPEGERLLALILGGGKLSELSWGGGEWVCRRPEGAFLDE